MFELHLLGFTVGSVVGAAVAKTEVGAAETSDDEGTSFDGCDGEGDIAVDAGVGSNLLDAEAVTDMVVLLCPEASVNATTVGSN